MTAGELIDEAIEILNAGSSQVNDSATRQRFRRALQRVCNKAWTFRPLPRRLASGVITIQTEGTGVLPSNFGSAGSKMKVYVDGKGREVGYLDPVNLFDLRERNPTVTSPWPRHYTLRGQNLNLHGQTMYGYPSPIEPVDLRLENYLSVAPTIVDRPASPVAATGGVGDLTGVYRYKVAFITPDGISELSRASDPVTVAAQEIELTEIMESAPHTVSGRILYRTEAGGEVFRELHDFIDDISTTAFTDNVADGDLGSPAPRIADALSGLEAFPVDFHTAILDGVVQLAARAEGDGRSAGELGQSAINGLIGMWAEEKVTNIVRRPPAYGSGY